MVDDVTPARQPFLIPPQAEDGALRLLDRPRPINAFAGDSYSPHVNPSLRRFIESNANARGPGVTHPFPENLVAGKNTYVYDAHTYHTKVPPEAISKLIEHFTEPGDLILDPFCGSGMTGVAALRTQRKPVLLDLSPAATFISMGFLTPIEEEKYRKAYRAILSAEKNEDSVLYGTHCRKCGSLVSMEYMVWSYGLVCEYCGEESVLWDVARDERDDVRESKIKSVFDCPHCGRSLQKRKLRRTRLYPVQVGYRCCESRLQETRAFPDAYDLEVIRLTESNDLPKGLWFPTAMLPVGVNTRQAIVHGLRSVDALYTKRNLRAVARLWDIASKWPDDELSAELLFTVTSLYQRVTRLSEFRFWGGSGNIANYNVPMIFNEQNVFRVFERKAKTIGYYLATWKNRPETPFCISTQSATDMGSIPDNSIDYIFTDPPFGGNINYSEMNFLWEAWLGAFTEVTNEAIINRVQGKTAETYRDLMTRAFREMHRVLKPGRWLTLAFHNSSSKVWAAIQAALAAAGFAVHRTQTLDKRHGTFKQFVSENAVGYDLIIHCQKTNGQTAAFPVRSRQGSSTASIREFVERALEQEPDDFVVRYLHVNRQNEFDARKLYSLWVKQQTEAGGVVNLDFEEFRRTVNRFVSPVPRQHRLLEEGGLYMERPRTLPAFSEKEYTRAHALLASRVAMMMGRKLEEQDWASVYRAAKNLSEGGWSNLNIDVMHKGLGVEHKMLCVSSHKRVKEYCGTSLMHPAATRAVRIPSTEGDATEIAREVLSQYAELVRRRRQKIAELSPEVSPDMRVGWLLWQENLKEFLYFEEEMIGPDLESYWAEWRESGGRARRASRNLWVYENDSGRKRYSITTSAGAKIQPYFDVPSPKDPHLYYFRVQGEELGDGLVRVWITSTTALLLKHALGSLDRETVSTAIIRAAARANAAGGSRVEGTAEPRMAEPILLSLEAYQALSRAFAGVSDEHMIQTFAHQISDSPPG